MAFSYVFWRLDERNVRLVHYGEDALKLFESRLEDKAKGDEAKVFKIFHEEERETEPYKSRSRTRKLLRPYTFTNCFQVIFLMFMAVGILGIIAAAVESWLVLNDWLTCPDPSEQK